MESALLRCPNCKKSFQVREDERFDHSCPHCGYGEREVEQMSLDVYVCQCEEEFAVKDGKEPVMCPFCGNDDLKWSHETE